MNKFNIGDEVLYNGNKVLVVDLRECITIPENWYYTINKYGDRYNISNVSESDLQPIDTQEGKTTLTTNANDGEYMQYQTEHDMGITGITNIPYTQTIMVDYEKKYNQSKEENATLKQIIQLQKQEREITNELVELYSKVDM